MQFNPDFSRGVGHAADQQVLLSACLQLRHQERLHAERDKFERDQALNGSYAILGPEGTPWVPYEERFKGTIGRAILSS